MPDVRASVSAIGELGQGLSLLSRQGGIEDRVHAD
jgi:hypothetical protein